MPSSTPSHCGFRRYFLFALVAFAGCFSSSENSARPAAPPLVSKDRPPLQILLVDAEFEEQLRIQWQAFSEQPIQIQRITSEEIAARPLDATDVWIYPNRKIGDLVAEEKILPLPPAAFGLPYSPDSDSDESASSVGKPSDRGVQESWPMRWRSVSRFGSSNFGLPLGAPQLVLMAKRLSLEPLDELDETTKSIDDRDSLAAAAWESLFEQLSKFPASDSEVIGKELQSMTAQQKDALVDRFLWIAATSNAKRRGLFELTRLQPRLSNKEFVNAAEVLHKLVGRFPETMLVTHSEAWSQIHKASPESPALAIAFPGVPSISSDESAALSGAESLDFSKLTFNPFEGLSASIGKKTRQTSVAAQFIAWLSTPEQRDALARSSDQVERWPNQPGPYLANADLRTYQNLSNREQRQESLVLSTRFANSQAYRVTLADCLVQILQFPERKQAILDECVKKWNAITESTGIMKQRKSVELSMGFGS